MQRGHRALYQQRETARHAGRGRAEAHGLREGDPDCGCYSQVVKQCAVSTLKTIALANTALKNGSRCSFTICKLRSFAVFRLVLDALMTFSIFRFCCK